MKLSFKADYDDVTLSLIPEEDSENGLMPVGDDGLIKFDNPRKSAFLAAYEACGVTARACKEIGISVNSVYNWQRTDPGFVACMKLASKVAAERIEAELLDRVLNGVGRKYKFDKEGNPVMWNGPDGEGEPQHYYEVVHSDGLMQLAIKAAIPEKYSERVKHEHEGTVKAYVCFDPTQIGTVSSADDRQALPASGERDQIDAMDGP